MKITDFVNKENICSFLYYRQGYMYYKVASNILGAYKFPVPVDDLGEATINNEEKSIFLMRYIRKAIDDNTIVPV